MARVAAGESVCTVATALSVAPASVIWWSQRLRTIGSAAPGRIGGYVPPKIMGERKEWLIERAYAAAFTLRGLMAELAERGLRVDYRTVWKFVHRERLSFKKPTGRPVCKGRIGWRVGLHQRIRSQGASPGQDGFRAFRAS